ncbi:hypothetical protein [Nonomuraea basaltis]|uniref:hypothetical protein n=1 Tax=Nonomuraea basaltis TaxID=2495887 RepID=UPI00110C4A0C|nr:hypothetical protein [Nonomuraea basaltis]TMR99551.1 hypothetical protein EJK15_06990 [Nonomuraea basaltis]
MIRLVAFLAVLAATSGASWVIYQDSKPGGILVFLTCMVVFVAPTYFRLMDIIPRRDDTKPGA